MSSYNPGAFDYGALAGDVSSMNASNLGSLYDPAGMGGFGDDVPMTLPAYGDLGGQAGPMPNFGGAGGGGGFFGDMTGGQKLGLGIGAIQTLLNGIMGFKQLGLAKKQFQFQRDFAKTNLANQIKTYNTSLSDRSRSRAKVEGQDPATAAAYVSQNSLSSPLLDKKRGG